MSIISKEEMDELIKNGRAKKVHWGSYSGVLKPRGSLQKESFSLYTLERLIANYSSWTDETHSDNPSVGDLLYQLKKNMNNETDIAWRAFLKLVNSGMPIEEAWDRFFNFRPDKEVPVEKKVK